jgi:putative copper resistance protein D
METMIVISRLAQFGGVMLLFGTSLFRCGFDHETEGRVFVRWHRRILATAAIVTMVSSLAWLDIEAGAMGGDWSDAGNLHTVATVLFQTRFGHVWQWNRVAAAILLCVTFARVHYARLWTALVVGLSGFLIATSAWTGHAVMHSGLTGTVHTLVQVVHVLAAAAWLGSLPALGFALRDARKAEQTAAPTPVQHLLQRYSRMGYVAVGLVLLTGCLNTWFMLDSFEALFSTLYGRVLVTKISLFLLMVGVALVNRFALTPEIANSNAGRAAAEASLRQLRRSVAVEQILGFLIITLVSVLGTLEPPMPGHMEM